MRNALFLAVLAIAGCRQPRPQAPDGAVRRVKLEPRAPGQKRNAKKPARAPQPLVLEPLAHAVQSPGARFERIEFDIGYPILRGTPVAEVKVTPALAGTVKKVAPQRFAFIPAATPAFETSYRFEVASVSTTRGKLVPKQAVFKVRTPAFAFLGADLGQHAERHGGRLRLRLRYSAPPRVAELLRLTTVRVDDVKVPIEVEKTDDATIVELSMKIGSDAKAIVVQQEAGVPAEAAPEKVLPAATTRVAVPTSLVEVRSVTAGSLGSRRYIEVFCADQLEPKVTIYSPRYVEASERCLPENAEAIEIEPKLKTTVMQVRGGFRIFGAFERGRYLVHLPSRLRTSRESTFVSNRMYPVRFDALAASTSIVGRGRYLPPEAWESLGLRTRNVLSATVTVRRIAPGNLSFWLSDSGEAADGRNSDLVAVGTLDVIGALDKEQLTYVDLDDLIKDRQPGVFEIRVEGGVEEAEPEATSPPAEGDEQVDEPAESGGDDDDDGYRRGGRRAKSAHDARRFVYTHVNLIAKREAQGGVRVWAIDLASLEEVSGAQVQLVVPSGRVLSSCSTDGHGSCALAGVPKDAVDRSEPVAVIARKGDDVSYLRFADVKLEPDTAVDGRPYEDVRPLGAVTYTDRGVYRPGETAHLVALVRDGKIHAPDKPIAIEARLIDPKTRLLRKLKATTNAAGVAAFDLAFADDADTGNYAVELFSDKVSLGATNIQVEEFVPERMQASIEPAKPGEHRVDEEVSFKVSAKYLFGGSAEGSGYKLRCSLQPGEFTAEKFAEYHFGPLALGIGEARQKSQVPVDEIEDKLGKGGVGVSACKGAGDQITGPQTLEASVAVMESGSGRATTAKSSVLLHPAPFYLGLKASSDTLVAAQPIELAGVVVGLGGEAKPLARDASVDLLKLERNVYWRRYDDAAEHTDYAAAFSEGKQKLSLKDGKFAVQLKPDDARADYLVRVTSGKATTELLLHGSGGDWDDWYYDGAGTAEGTPRPEKPTSLVLAADGAVRVGQSFPVRFESRFSGRALITVETNRVVESAWIDVKPGKNAWHFALDAFAPNVYVSVLAFKNPHQESATTFLPERAFGVVSVPVDHASHQHALKVTVPTEIRSNAGLDVLLDIGATPGPTFATVAAVDEGILRLTGFESPDPLGALFAKRALGVTSYETVGWNVAAPAQGKQIGGDSDEEGQKGEGGRAQPVKPVALWSGVVELDSSGRARVHFDVPTYRGALRVMAVTLGAEKLGAASQKVLVRDPIVLQTTAPRFLVKDDIARVPVFLSNLSGEARDVAVEVTVVDPVEDAPISFGRDRGVATVEAIGPRSLHLGKGQSGVLRVALTARAIGVARLSVRAVSKGLTVSELLEIPIEPSLPLLQKATWVALTAGENKIGGAPLGTWLPGTERNTLKVVSNPYAQALSSLDYLLGYPYGCIEQTTSATRPLLAARRLLEEIPPKLKGKDTIDARLQAGLRRIFSMQTPAGGFGYWPGAHDPHLWGSAYATHLLLDARDAKLEVSPSRLTDALDFLERALDGLERSPDYHGWSDYRSEPYIQYVLARASRSRAGRVRELISVIESARALYYRTNQELAKLRDRASLASIALPLLWLDVASLDEDLYLLKAALYLSGDKKYAHDLESLDLHPIYYLREYAWSFYSDLRSRGIQLAIYGDLFGASAKAKPMMDLLVETLSSHPAHYFNTQELGWVLTAIAKQVGPSGEPVEASLSMRGHEVPSKRVSPRAAPSWSLRSLSREEGTLTMKKTSQPRYALAITEGVPARAEDVPLGDHGIAVAREYLDSSGNSVSLENVALGEVIYVKLTIENTQGRPLSNIALVDRLPAGFEIENPRLGRGDRRLEWMNALHPWQQEFMNLRDDRFEAFGALYPRQSAVVVYAVRATSAGHFTAPVAQAEAMYDPEVWGRTEPVQVVVKAD